MADDYLTPRSERQRSSIERMLASEWLIVPAAILFALGIAFNAVRIVKHYHVPVQGGSVPFGLSDFHNAVYFPGLAFSRGENPYSTEYARAYPVNRALPPYSPAILWFVLPFGWLPLHAAETVWFILSLLLIVCFAWVTLRYVQLPYGTAPVLLASAALLFSRSGHSNLVPGQWAPLMCLGMFLAVNQAQTRPNIAAVCFALTTLKPTFGLPLGMLLLLIGQFRVAIVGGMLAAILAGTAIGMLLMNDSQAIVRFLSESHASHIADKYVDPTYAWLRVDTISTLARLWGTRTSGTAEFVVMCMHVLPIGLLLRNRARGSGQVGNVDPFQLPLILLTVPVSVYHMAYDALSTIPVLAACAVASPEAYRRLARSTRLGIVCLLAIPQVNYVTTWPVLTALNIQPGLLRNVLASINGCAILTALILLAVAVASLRDGAKSSKVE